MCLRKQRKHREKVVIKGSSYVSLIFVCWLLFDVFCLLKQMVHNRLIQWKFNFFYPINFFLNAMDRCLRCIYFQSNTFSNQKPFSSFSYVFLICSSFFLNLLNTLCVYQGLLVSFYEWKVFFFHKFFKFWKRWWNIHNVLATYEWIQFFYVIDYISIEFKLTLHILEKTITKNTKLYHINIIDVCYRYSFYFVLDLLVIWIA